MSDPHTLTPEEAKQRAKRLALPYVILAEWASLHGVKPSTARLWVADSAIREQLGAYKSPPTERGTWIIPPTAAVPAPRPEGAAAHKRKAASPARSRPRWSADAR